MKILITGGTGFIATRLIDFLGKEQHEITILSRHPEKIANHSVSTIQHLHELHESIEVVINLAGAPIDKRWTASYKKTLIDSRVHLTSDLVEWMAKQKEKPRVFISGSAIGFYGTGDASPLDETSKAHQSFTHTLCSQWESTALAANKLGIRTCVIRLGVVLGKHGGALKKMLPSFKLGLGGQFGDGQQFFSWIHIEDVCRAICFLIDNTHLDGAFNLTAPNAVTNKKFTQVLGSVIHRPTCFSMPEIIVGIVFGEMGNNLLLRGQNVLPKRLQDAGFNFHYESLQCALTQILNKKSGY